MLQRSADAAASAASVAREREAALREQLQQDAAWQKHQRVRTLWAESGAEALWEEYAVLDTSEGRERFSRGQAFEGRAVVCFAMLVRRLQEGTARVTERFSYRRGALWVDRRGRTLGEIDVVVTYDGCVCALLEMKAGCFEVAAGMAQHEAKLSLAQRSVARAAEDGAAAHDGPFIAESHGWGARRLPLPPAGVTVPVYVATLLPPHPFVIGAEPALTRAVCDALFGRPAEQRGARARAHAEARCTVTPPPPPIASVEVAVRQKMGERLRLSPLGCMRTRADRVLVVEVPDADSAASRPFLAALAAHAGGARRDGSEESEESGAGCSCTAPLTRGEVAAAASKEACDATKTTRSVVIAKLALASVPLLATLSVALVMVLTIGSMVPSRPRWHCAATSL